MRLKIILNIVLPFACFLSNSLYAQELECNVTVDASQLRNYDAEYRLQDFSSRIKKYLNDYRWTNSDDFELPEDRITCTLKFSILSADMSTTPAIYTASVIVIAMRPVYQSEYKSILIKILDPRFQFTYDNRSTALIHNELVYTHPLSTFLDFYAQLILGLDADTFSPLGGTEYLQKALQSSQLISQSRAVFSTGWHATGPKNTRGVFIKTLFSDHGTNFRKIFYKYHYEGLDALSSNLEQGYKRIIQTLSYIKESRGEDSMIHLQFLDAKHVEIASILSNAPANIKAEGKALLLAIDPSRKSVYDRYFSSN